MPRLATELERLSLDNFHNWSLVLRIDHISVHEDKENKVFWGHCENDGMTRLSGPFSSYEMAYQKAQEMLSYIF